MRILFVGDVYGRPGRRATAELVPELRQIHGIDFCIANGENSAGGFGITANIGRKFHTYGVDVITTGNHVWDQKESVPYVLEGDRLLRPANFPREVGGIGYGVFPAANGLPVGVVCLQGRTNMISLDCPFQTGRSIAEELRGQTPVAVVDFHAEATSEKVAFGWYMDGQVSAVIGTHTHVQTADEQILPGGTAYITDVGMTGPHDSVIGAVKESAIRRFVTRMPARFEPASRDIKLCGVVLDVDDDTGKCRHIERLRMDLEEE